MVSERVTRGKTGQNIKAKFATVRSQFLVFAIGHLKNMHALLDTIETW